LRICFVANEDAENPLSQSAQRSGQRLDEKENESKEELGNYETEQLINAIAKIADLLRKCWGVAGAGIISSNLARTKDGKTVVFNPTVPGKSVYALFGFVAINDFSKQLRVLGDDVMKLINDVARVVHDEVFRWALNDSGQCNKNLGAAFLMVFRIGDFSEVHEKQRRAAAVVFKGQQKKSVRSRKQRSKYRRSSTKQIEGGPALQLASLPGIQSFADRALLGLLKSFAGIHRDKHLREWEGDWRLGAGVGAFKVSVIYGMDAGWAVEGAVGSEYKIDATYLSPHVNMASRMMSACKQYGVTMLMSQAVEELLSRTARSKLRHLDTVYVKGSSVAQRIYTYDCRFDGVDYFLYERTPEQADAEAAAYTQSIWDTDQDLQGMRQHVGDDFMEKFSDGVQHYLDGRWTEAVELLQDADDLMLRKVLDEGYVDHKADDFGGKLFDRNGQSEFDDEINRIRNDFGDGPCKCLVQYMLRRKCKPPSDWNGVRALMSK
jgi:class 3 adenylate cyclase